MSSSEIVQTDAVERVVELLKAAAQPLTFAQMKKAAHLDEAALKSALEAAGSRGDVFRWPDYRRQQCFWFRSPDAVAQEAILAVASQLALSRPKLVSQGRKRVRGFSAQSMDRIVANLLLEKQLQTAPAFGAGKVLIKSGAVDAYAASARAFIEDKFRKAGFDPASWLASRPSGSERIAPAPSVDAARLILDAIQTLEPLTGVPVSVQRLRNRLPDLSKSGFDAAALELRKRQQVFLSLDHDPHNLSQQERDVLIDGRDGTYYVAIAIR